MKRLPLAALLAAAALAAACGRSPAASEAHRAPAGAAHDRGYLGSGNFVDTTTAGRP
jgi:hypothetical protein